MAATKTTQPLQQTISTPSAEAHGWQHHIGKNWHNRAPASGEYTITSEDGRVRPKHVDE
jgi:regulator of PEP synthase PpsR (kinase-PPPase family)